MMMTVLACIAFEHDLTLVAPAALVCVMGAWATMRLLHRAAAATSTERKAWLLLGSVVAGAAIWCTHFVSMLGYDPGVPISFDAGLTVASLLFTLVGTLIGLTIALNTRIRAAPAIGGAVVGLAIVLMHYSGMMAYRVQGIVSWDMSYLVASIVLSVVLSSLAVHFALRNSSAWDMRIGTGILVLAIVSLHFTGMTAFRVEPFLVEGSFSNPAALRTLAFAVVCVALIVVVTAGVACNLIDRRARTEAAEALSNMSNGLLMIDADGTVQLFNSRVETLFGLRPGQLHLGLQLDDFLNLALPEAGWDEENLARIRDDHRRWIESGELTRIEHHFDDGRVIAIACRPLDGGGAVLTYDDVTEAREGQKKIAHMAFHDALTGLQNRRSFTSAIEGMASTSRFAMLMIDLDRFKSVNDMLGHGVGDKLLMEVAQRLRNVSRASDLLFRLGGDEFAILAAAKKGYAQSLSTRIVNELRHPFQIDEHRLQIGGSVGVAMVRPGEDPETVQRKSDLALYKAKRGGRGRVEFYQDGMIEEADERRRVEIDLARGFEQGELELHYQPLYKLPHRKLVGFEALVRWRHPEKGLIAPADFIPIAEQNGTILQIGAWIMDEACRQASLWPADLYVSINVSPVQLRSTEILHQVSKALDVHGLLPRRIEIEVTETAVAESGGRIAQNLTDLRILGVRIAMDDFGTGYSSLAHLREFQIDRIKIDRTFISASEDDVGAKAVVKAVTSMARDLDIETTGEGVESEDQLESLANAGCGTVQGFLLSHPLDAASADALVERHRQERTVRLIA